MSEIKKKKKKKVHNTHWGLTTCLILLIALVAGINIGITYLEDNYGFQAEVLLKAFDEQTEEAEQETTEEKIQPDTTGYEKICEKSGYSVYVKYDKDRYTLSIGNDDTTFTVKDTNSYVCAFGRIYDERGKEQDAAIDGSIIQISKYTDIPMSEETGIVKCIYNEQTQMICAYYNPQKEGIIIELKNYPNFREMFSEVVENIEFIVITD